MPPVAENSLATLTVLSSVLVACMPNSEVGYVLLTCGNSLPYFHSCGMMWLFIPRESEHWKSWCVWAFNFLAAIALLMNVDTFTDLR